MSSLDFCPAHIFIISGGHGPDKNFRSGQKHISLCRNINPSKGSLVKIQSGTGPQFIPRPGFRNSCRIFLVGRMCLVSRTRPQINLTWSERHLRLRLRPRKRRPSPIVYDPGNWALYGNLITWAPQHTVSPGN